MQSLNYENVISIYIIIKYTCLLSIKKFETEKNRDSAIIL